MFAAHVHTMFFLWRQDLLRLSKVPVQEWWEGVREESTGLFVLLLYHVLGLPLIQ